ncbi:hypothetical protein DmAi_26490 [Acetobacter persici]|uniref:Uncharacterized protein n=1 Tax=Acetobacter persici TaxID=1076596 RepID=A0A6V8IAI6_9PROT|nr:hypothetical protein DmAi_26490 [Acetobacter persici]
MAGFSPGHQAFFYRLIAFPVHSGETRRIRQRIEMLMISDTLTRFRA